MLTLTTLDILDILLSLTLRSSSSSQERGGNTAIILLLRLEKKGLFTARKLIFKFFRKIGSLVDIPIVLAPSIEKGDDRVQKEEKDETKDDDLLRMDVEV